MGTGYLKVQTRAGEEALPVTGARIVVRGEGKRYEAYSDETGVTEPLALPAPDKALTLDPAYGLPAYSSWEVKVLADGYETVTVEGVQVLDAETAILPVEMVPATRQDGPGVEIEIPPIGLLVPQTGVQEGGEGIVTRTLREVIIPDYITVHLGSPGNASARNLRVRFPDYIKNVASSEIYATWPVNSLIANIHVIVTFAINRVYTEWYRSRGYHFDITNNTGYDQYYREGGQIYENISRLVDDLFNVYARRAGYRNPFFTAFCNGTTATCAGLSQWGTVTLAQQGMTPLQILRYYYPDDLELVTSNNISGISESYPGSPLRVGSRGEPVQRMQTYLNRIRRNYPAIPAVAQVDGVFGAQTQAAVRKFQQVFSLTADGVIGRATWNKISSLYVAVTRLAELDSEGERVDIGTTPPTTVISQGSRGALVTELQYMLNAISARHPSIPALTMDGIFGPKVRAAVVEFQRLFGLRQDGAVGPATWRQLYAVYHGDTAESPRYPGAPLRVGSRGENVRLVQRYLNKIRTVHPGIHYLDTDGAYGTNTRNAVATFQGIFGLTQDGIVGPATWDAIVRQYQAIP